MDQDKGIAVTNFTKKCYFPTSKGGGGGQKQDELLEVLLTMKTDKESCSKTYDREGEHSNRYRLRGTAEQLVDVQHVGN